MYHWFCRLSRCFGRLDSRKSHRVAQHIREQFDIRAREADKQAAHVDLDTCDLTCGCHLRIHR